MTREVGGLQHNTNLHDPRSGLWISHWISTFSMYSCAFLHAYVVYSVGGFLVTCLQLTYIILTTKGSRPQMCHGYSTI
jgi:hypothetical protein